MKNLSLSLLWISLLVLTPACNSGKEQTVTGDKYTVAAFYWPAYHYEPKSEFLFPEKTGEWEIIRNAVPKEEGHQQPKVPLWGYLDEANPKDMELKITTALEYGVNTFIFDWYWFEKAPFLERCINDGFLKANNDRMNFYLMWANHDVKKNYWNVHKFGEDESILWDGAVNREQFSHIVERVINQYFSKPNYLKINGMPVFSIFSIHNLLEGFGSPDRRAHV